MLFYFLLFLIFYLAAFFLLPLFVRVRLSVKNIHAVLDVRVFFICCWVRVFYVELEGVTYYMKSFFFEKAGTLTQLLKKRRKPKEERIPVAAVFKKAVAGRSFSVNVKAGLKEADKTALLCGLFHIILHPVALFFPAARVSILPNYQKPAIEGEGGCIISIVPAHIISTALLEKKRKKKARVERKNAYASN